MDFLPHRLRRQTPAPRRKIPGVPAVAGGKIKQKWLTNGTAPVHGIRSAGYLCQAGPGGPGYLVHGPGRKTIDKRVPGPQVFYCRNR
jgi:hypothetical protein